MLRGPTQLRSYGAGRVRPSYICIVLSNDWQALQEKVLAFMEQFKGGSQPLLRYVGLLPN